MVAPIAVADLASQASSAHSHSTPSEYSNASEPPGATRSAEVSSTTTTIITITTLFGDDHRRNKLFDLLPAEFC